MKNIKTALVATLLAAAFAVPVASASAGEPAAKTTAAPIVATFEIASHDQEKAGKVERFKVKFEQPWDIKLAQELAATPVAERGAKWDPIPHPIGKINRGGADVNTDPSWGKKWNWHLDGAGFTDFSTEVCDGLPSDVQSSAWRPADYCPWGATLISIEPAP